jgi:hypothetical protein
MSKTHLVLTKETGIAIAIIIGLVIMAIVDLSLLTPTLIDVLMPAKNAANQNPIDQETVKEAIKVINQ